MKHPFSVGAGRAPSSLRAIALGLILPIIPIPLAAQIPASTVVVAEPALLGDAELDELLGPIALYPDALIGLILPASTLPHEVTLGARYLNGGDLNVVDQQPWDESIRGLVRYPEVLTWMDENLEWTTALGEAFVLQPADVMNSVQRLRSEAQAAGNLVNTPQQTVVVQQEAQQEIIRIVPANPEIIYVPVYDPQVVYVERARPDYIGNILSFGAGFAVGSWLSYDVNWGRRQIYYGNNCGWNNRPYWNHRGWYDGGRNVNVIENTNITNINNVTNVVNNNANTWVPSATTTRQITDRNRNNNGNSRFVNGARKPNNFPATANSDRRVVPLPRPTKLATNTNRPGIANKPVKTGGIGNQVAGNRQQTASATTASKPNSNSAGPNSKKPNSATNNSKKPSTPPKVTGSTKPNQNPKPGSNSKAPANPSAGSAKPVASSKSPNSPSVSNTSRPKSPSAPPKISGSSVSKPSGKPNVSAKPSSNSPSKPSSSASSKPVSKPGANPVYKPTSVKPAPKPVTRPSTTTRTSPPQAVQAPKPSVQKPQPRPQVQQPRPPAQQPKPRTVQTPKPQPSRPQVQQPRPQVQKPQPRPQQSSQPNRSSNNSNKSSGGSGNSNKSKNDQKKKS